MANVAAAGAIRNILAHFFLSRLPPIQRRQMIHNGLSILSKSPINAPKTRSRCAPERRTLEMRRRRVKTN